MFQNTSNFKLFGGIVLLFIIVFFNSGCKEDESTSEPTTPSFLPLSDADNAGGWIFKDDLSDEFEDAALNENKWHIQGKEGDYKSNFVGRPPSQFSINNVRLEDGKLKIQTRWEPDYPFSPTTHPTSGETFENITTAAVIGKKHFRYGYMEIKCKSANAPITSSFWTTSNSGEPAASELDMFEMFGGHKTSADWRKRLKFNIISWDDDNPYYFRTFNGSTYSDNIQITNNTADNFHVYGF